MPILVEWFDDQQTIAIYHMERHWVIADLSKQLEAHATLGEKQPRYYIVDMSQSTMFPNGILYRHNEYTQFFRLSEGMTVIVKAPQLAIIAIRILSRFGVKLHNIEFVDTINEAVETITAHQQVNDPARSKLQLRGFQTENFMNVEPSLEE